MSKQKLGNYGYWDSSHSHSPDFLFLISAKQMSANVDLSSGASSTGGTGSTSVARNEYISKGKPRLDVLPCLPASKTPM